SVISATGASSAVLVVNLHAKGVSSLASNARIALLGLLEGKFSSDDLLIDLLTHKDPRDSQASPRSNQKEEIRRKNTGPQMHNDPNGSETAIFFHSDLGTALQPISYGSQTDQAYQNHPSRSGEGITNGRAERHGQTLAQPNNIQAISEPMATTGLDCDVLPPLSPALDEEFLDLNFSSHERLYIDLEPQHSNSTTSCSEDKCHCLLYIIQSLNRNRQETHTRRDPMNRIQLLNEAAEQFLMCDSNHSKLWYIILLALYQDADDSLSSPGELQEMVGEQSEAKESYSNIKSSLNGINSKKRNVLLKTFILLSSTASALPFKFGIDTDDKFSSEIIESFAGLVRDRFENRLLEQTDEARLCK
ncbi:hypothetical protein BS50DRAFT_656605, partial [Corynespora cassiicola Philippines]